MIALDEMPPYRSIFFVKKWLAALEDLHNPLIREAA
jgi:hypothetical protein